MITAHANSGIDALHSVLTSADTQLENISNRLQSEFALNHSQPNTNPFTLLRRLRSLQTALPALKQQLLTIHQQKAKLVTQCTTHLAETTRLGRSVLPLAIPASSDPKSLDADLSHAQSSLTALLAHFSSVNTEFIESFDAADHQLNFALLRAVADTDLPSVQPRQTPLEETPLPQHSVPDNTPVTTPATTKPVAEKTKTKKTVTVQESIPSPQFVPVSKVVYKRLPRNLKIKAGKLPQINQFYEKVFNVLRDASSPLSDAELRNATGEHDMTKFDVLRGLAVLRHSKRGWVLAG